MSLPASLFAIAALVPAMSGPTSASGGVRELTLPSCFGHSVTIRLAPAGDGTPAPTICCAKGCESRDRKRKFDPGQ